MTLAPPAAAPLVITPLTVATLAVPATNGGRDAAHHALRRPTVRLVLVAVGRRLVPNIIEATLVPGALFIAATLLFGLVAAFTVALAWSYLMIARRVVTRRPVPALLVLGAIGITLRTALALGSGSAFVYFVQPIVGTFVVGSAFLASVALGRPLVGRFARDFCPLDPEVERCAGVVRLYRHLTYLWAAVNFTAAATTLTLLCMLPVQVFVAVRPLTGWVVTGTGVVLTVTAAVRAARAEGLVAAISPCGRLTAVRA